MDMSESGKALDKDEPQIEDEEKHFSTRDALISASDRGFGRKRRRIDSWIITIRGGYY
jgi:hypothetical protein